MSRRHVIEGSPTDQVRAIGLSNFEAEHIEELWNQAKVFILWSCGLLFTVTPV